MKGTVIATWLQTSRQLYGDSCVDAAMAHVGWEGNKVFRSSDVIDDRIPKELIQKIALLGNTSPSEVWRRIGVANIKTFADVYPAFFQQEGLFSFLSSMNEVHRIVTERIPGAKPPFIGIQQLSKHEALLTYRSSRMLDDYLKGLLEGAAAKFREKMLCEEVGRDADGSRIKLTFERELKNENRSPFQKLRRHRNARAMLGFILANLVLLFFLSLAFIAHLNPVYAYSLFLLTLLGDMLMGYYFYRKYFKPLVVLVSAMKDLAQGRSSVDAKIDIRADGEVRELADYINRANANLSHTMKGIYNASADLSDSSLHLLQIADTLEANSKAANSRLNQVSSTVSHIAARIGNAAEASAETSQSVNITAASIEEMSGTIGNIAGSSGQTSENIGQISTAVDQISRNINGVSENARDISGTINGIAISVKEINLSLNEISQNCARALTITGDAKMKIRDTHQIIDNLNEMSQQTGKIVDLINNIASQTNMLSLNAAIEAVGAGEAGRGFAVVANEVKQLSKQTAESTNVIRDQIENMRTGMAEAVASVETITEVINEITAISNMIAAAVTEQSAVTGGISDAALGGAAKVSDITQSIQEVAAQSQNAAHNIAAVFAAARDVARAVAELSVASREAAGGTEQSFRKVNEIAADSLQVSQASNEIAASVREISTASHETAVQAGGVNNAARRLAEVAQNLEYSTEQFKSIQ